VQRTKTIWNQTSYLFAACHKHPCALSADGIGQQVETQAPSLRSKKACKEVIDNLAFSLNTSSRSAVLQRSSSDHKPSRAPIVARWADRFSRCWWRRFSRFLACPLILPLPRGEYPSACQSLFIFAPRRRCCLAAAAPRLCYSDVCCNAATTLHTVHRNTDLNPKYFHRFAFLAFASGT